MSCGFLLFGSFVRSVNIAAKQNMRIPKEKEIDKNKKDQLTS
jgi:hypothetical protein